VQIKKLKAAGCDEIFQEKISGAKDDRPQLDELLGKLRKNDVFCVVRLDRLGRRMLKLVDMINELKEKNVEFVALENNIDTSTPMGMLLFNICAAFSEMERELIKERVKAGLDSAKEKGRVGGRPKVITKEKEAILHAIRNEGSMSVKQMCKTVGVSRSVYYRAMSEHQQALTLVSQPKKSKKTKSKPKKGLIPDSTGFSQSHIKKKAITLDLWLRVENNSKFVRGKGKSRKYIEDYLRYHCGMEKPNKDSWDYKVTFEYKDKGDLDKQIDEMFRSIHCEADRRNGFVETSLVNPETEMEWEFDYD